MYEYNYFEIVLYKKTANKKHATEQVWQMRTSLSMIVQQEMRNGMKAVCIVYMHVRNK
jgi:hypothetical protein